jgi:O-antigen/teichoic acid export membrane protein
LALPHSIRKFASNSAWLLFERIGTALVGVLVAALVARYLGPVDFGKLAYTFSIAAMFAVVGHLGLDGLIVRELIAAPGAAGTTLGTALALRVVAFGAAAVSLVVFAFVVPGHDAVEQGLFTFAAVFTLLSALDSLTAWFHSRVDGRTVSLIHMAGTLSGSATKVLLVFFGGSAVWFGAANIVTITTTAMLLIVIFRRLGGPALTTWRLSIAKARQLMSEGIIILLGGIFAIIYLKIDLIMLRWLSGEKVVGEYAVAAQISEAAYMIPIAIVASVFPRLIELKSKNQAVYGWRLQQVFDSLLLASIPVVAGAYLFGEFFLDLLFGEAYASSTAILLIHILAAPFIFMRYAFSRWILIERVAIFSLLTQGAGACINVAINLILIPHFAGVGAAIATVISYAVASYLSLAIWPRTRPVFFMMSRSLFMPWAAVGRVLHKPPIVAVREAQS